MGYYDRWSPRYRGCQCPYILLNFSFLGPQMNFQMVILRQEASTPIVVEGKSRVDGCSIAPSIDTWRDQKRTMALRLLRPQSTHLVLYTDITNDMDAFRGPTNRL